jgi:glycosyltransferase involved in cell wall biosynthesis
MHILYVSPYFPPEPGAPSARVSELARAWVEAGHEVTVLTGMPNHPTGIIHAGYRGKSFLEEDFHGARVLRTWIYAAPNRGRVRRSLAFASFAASAVAWGQLRLRRPDVIVATSPQFLSAVAGYAIAQLRRTPFVFEVRDLWPESIVAVGALPSGHWIVRLLEKMEVHLYEAAQQIVVVTDSFRGRLAERGIPNEKIAVIKNGVDLERFTPRGRDTDLRNRLGFGARFVVSYVGTLGMAHGLDAVLDVAKQLCEDGDIRFLFVGDGAERKRLEARASSEGIDNVTFLGSLPRDAMNEVYATSDVCLVPLRKAALFQTVIPSKIFEIFGMARPIILSVEGEAREIVAASKGGVFVPPEDVAGMRDAIVMLSKDRDLCARMGELGRQFVERTFDRQRLANDYLRVLEKVLSARLFEAA